MSGWIDRAEALARLGVRAQTLYAYVSRGRISARPDPADSRRSLYAVADIEALAARRRRGRKAGAIAASAIAWGEPALPTAIATVDKGRLIYRGHDAAALCATASLEDIAALLWDQAEAPAFRDTPAAAPFAGPFAALADLAESGPASLGRSAAQLARAGAQAVGRLASGFGLPASAAPLHERLAACWSIDAGGADLIRRTLVLMADHDLNASTFAVRVAASTGASVPACLLAGLAALSGPRHGGAGAALAMLVGQAERDGARAAIDRWFASGHELPGFGHMLYPQGDARALALLACLTLDPVMAELRRAVAEMTDELPNIDFALLALTRRMALPADAPFRLFALGRSVGWVAHAIEQALSGALIRPRGRYEGPIFLAAEPGPAHSRR